MIQDLKDNRGQKIGSFENGLNGAGRIYNKMGSRIGEIIQNGHRLEAIDKTGRMIAYWDKNNDTTFDRIGRKLGKGNLLVGMFFEG